MHCKNPRLLFQLLLLALSMGWLLWRGAVQEPQDIRMEYAYVSMGRWEHGARPVRVAVLGDIHAAKWDATYLDRIVEMTLQAKPEVVFLLGDYCFTTGACHFAMPPQELAEHLAPLARHCTVYYVMGNHDAFRELADLGPALRKAGFMPLYSRRDRVHVFSNGQGVILRGAPFVPEKNDASALQSYFKPSKGGRPGRPLITVAHNPYHFLRWELAGDLILCGHTHGGQICLPGMLPILPAGEIPTRWQCGGWHRAANGSPLYITRGTGMTKLPLRFNCPPEITILELRAK